MTIDQIRRGALNYIEKELAPHMADGKGVVLKFYAALAAIKLPTMVAQCKDMPAVSFFGVVAPDGDIDVESLAYAAGESFFANGRKQVVSLPGVDAITFSREDLDRLMSYIKA